MTLGLTVLSLLLAQADLPTAPASLPAVPVPEAEPAYCTGEYADSLSALSVQARLLEETSTKYTRCVRSTATYECLSYGSDGNVRRTRTTVSAHGTAFAYRQQGGDTLLLTNNHVSEWPAVTDEAHPVEGVPTGCKRVSDSLRLVDSESDAYERDDIALSRVVNDPQLDMSVLKAHAALPILPWKVGHSAALRERNLVDVRGFPLGVFKATNVGKVVSAYDHDEYKDWNHDDFVIDALLSPGNSGSPVLAISCKTGEFELVGVYHAGYSRGSALNVVVGIDQVRDLMTSFKRSPKRASDESVPLDNAARAGLIRRAQGEMAPFFSFGNRPAAVRARADGALVFELYGRDFPRKVAPLLVLEDLLPADGTDFGDLGRVWFGNERGLKERARRELEAETQQQLSRVLDALRRDAVAAFNYREALPTASDSRPAFENKLRLEKLVERMIGAHQDLSDAASDLADHLSPQTADEAVTRLGDIYRPLAPVEPAIPALPVATSASSSGVVAPTTGKAQPPAVAPTAPSAPVRRTEAGGN